MNLNGSCCQPRGAQAFRHVTVPKRLQAKTPHMPQTTLTTYGTHVTYFAWFWWMILFFFRES